MTIEGYYQESGRAGRDGEPAESVVFYSQETFRLQRFVAGSSDAVRGRDGHCNVP